MVPRPSHVQCEFRERIDHRIPCRKLHFNHFAFEDRANSRTLKALMKLIHVSFLDQPARFTLVYTLRTGQGDSRMIAFALVRRRPKNSCIRPRPITTSCALQVEATSLTTAATSPVLTQTSKCVCASCCNAAIRSFAVSRRKRLNGASSRTPLSYSGYGIA